MPRVRPDLRGGLQRAGEREHRLVKVDIDANQDLAQAAGIQAVPTLMIAKQGEVIFQQAGALQAADLDDLIAQAKALDLAAAKAAQSGADQQA